MTGPCRILVTGSRAWQSPTAIHDALLEAWHDAQQDGAAGIVVVHGAAPGADSIAAAWAQAHKGDGVEEDPHPADWTGPCDSTCRPGHRRRRRDGTDYCPTAGHRRNQEMVNTGASICLAFQRDGSTGTADCMGRAAKAGVPVRVWAA